jgi:hypothetical protein
VHSAPIKIDHIKRRFCDAYGRLSSIGVALRGARPRDAEADPRRRQHRLVRLVARTERQLVASGRATLSNA